MNVSKSLAAAIAATTIVGAVGLAHAQTTSDTPASPAYPQTSSDASAAPVNPSTNAAPAVRAAPAEPSTAVIESAPIPFQISVDVSGHPIPCVMRWRYHACHLAPLPWHVAASSAR